MTAEVFRNCFVCDYKAVTVEVACPKCGKPLQTEAMIRGLGGLLAFLGFLLISVMAFAMSAISKAKPLDRPGHYGENAGNASAESLAFAILLAVMLMGASTVLAGGWMFVTGRRNLKLLWFMIAFGLALGTVGYVFRGFVS